jgi:hypothetical protein
MTSGVYACNKLHCGLGRSEPISAPNRTRISALMCAGHMHVGKYEQVIHSLNKKHYMRILKIEVAIGSGSKLVSTSLFEIVSISPSVPK